jgi:hypothetical protein
MPESEFPSTYRIISAGEAESRYAVSADVHFPYQRFAEHQEIRLYEGSVQVPGDLSIWEGDNDDARFAVNVIVDGDLAIDGNLSHGVEENSAGYFHLVTGSLRARNLFLYGFPEVVVRGGLAVANGVVAEWGQDGGFLVVKGATSAQVIINTGYFTMSFGVQPQATVVADPDRTSCNVDFPDDELKDVLLPEFLDEDDEDMLRNVRQALGNGQPVLRTIVPAPAGLDE